MVQNSPRVQTYDAIYSFTVVRRVFISLFLFQMPNKIDDKRLQNNPPK